MKVKDITLPNKTIITFYIGENAMDNEDVISIGDDNDLWFHATNCPSSHVLAKMPEKYTKKEKGYVIKIGAQLCKHNTSKLQKEKDVAITYTRKKYLQLTKTPGSVYVEEGKCILIQ